MIHHADFAIPVHQRIRVETNVDPDGNGVLKGRMISLGWWVDTDAIADPDHQPVGTLYLIADPSRSRPYWITQSDLVSTKPLD